MIKEMVNHCNCHMIQTENAVELYKLIANEMGEQV